VSQWLRITLTIPRHVEAELVDIFGACDALAITTEASADQPAWLDVAEPVTPTWKTVRISALFALEASATDIVTRLGATGLIDNPTDINVDYLADQVWERVWLQHFQAFEAAQGLWIVPSGQQASPDAKVCIELEPGLAFGTGTHPTTALCLAALTEMDLAAKHVLDYGCGSGILAIAAIKLGAASAVAVDIDARALTAAIENGRRNSVEDRLRVLSTDEIAKEHTADLVIANILADTLIELSGLLTGSVRDDGVLMLSGILADQVDRVAGAFAGSFAIDVRHQEQWSLLTARRLTRGKTD
jgi:ribosomal protein L11 methyltransferase